MRAALSSAAHSHCNTYWSRSGFEPINDDGTYAQGTASALPSVEDTHRAEAGAAPSPLTGNLTVPISRSAQSSTPRVVILVERATLTMPVPRSAEVPRGGVVPVLPRPPRGGEPGPPRHAPRAA